MTAALSASRGQTQTRIFLQHPLFEFELMAYRPNALVNVRPELFDVARFVFFQEQRQQRFVIEVVAAFENIPASRGDGRLVDAKRPVNRFHRFRLALPTGNLARRLLDVPNSTFDPG